MTMVRNKTLRMLLYDYQRTARYYTIYRTFTRGCQPVRPAADRCQTASRRDDPIQVETLTHQHVRRVCTAGSVSALAVNAQAADADPAGLEWSAVCCTILYALL